MTGERSDKLHIVSAGTKLTHFIYCFPLKCYFAAFHKLWELLFISLGLPLAVPPLQILYNNFKHF